MEFETSLEVKQLKKYRFLLPYFLLVLIIFFAINVLQSRWNKITGLRQTIADKKQEISRLQSRVDQIESISAAEVEGRMETVLYALPQTKDPTLILSTAKALAISNNLLINEITFSPGDIALQPKADTSSQVEKVAVNFQLAGEIADLIGFLNYMDDILPIMRPTSFSIEWQKAQPAFQVEAITFNAYSDQPPVTQAGDVTLTAKEDKVYQELLGMEKIGQGVTIGQEEFQPADSTRDPFQVDLDSSSAPSLPEEAETEAEDWNHLFAKSNRPI